MTKFEDTVASGAMRMTADGYLVGEVRCARTGIQKYMASDVGMPGGGVVSVYRPDSTVFSKDSMATFAGKPVTMRHPPVAVTADNWKQYAIGDIGEEIARDGEFIRVPIKIMDSEAIRDIQSGVREISMGYTCGITVGAGVTPDGKHYDAMQTGHIRINHLAAVEKARGGEKLRIGDGALNWGATPVTDNQPGDTPINRKTGGLMADSTKAVILGDNVAQIPVADAALVEQFKTDSAKALTDAKAEYKTAIEAKDEEIGKLKADLKAAKDAAVIDVDALVAARTDLLGKVKAIDAKIDPKGMSDADLRKAAVVAKLGDETVKDASEAEINGMFKAIAKDVKPVDPVADAFRSGVQTPVGDSAQQMNDAHDKSVSDLNAWRTAQ